MVVCGAMTRWIATACLVLWACSSSQGEIDAVDSGPSDSSADVEAALPMLDFPVDEKGPFQVGYRTMDVSYQPPGTESPRSLVLNIWYPTEQTEGENPTYLFFLDTESIVDASLAPPVHPDGYPVHIYSHGHRGFGGTASFMMRYFASHGWVVLAPDHTGNTLSDTIDPRPVSLYFLRATDISASLDAVAALDPADPLSGSLLLDDVLMSGHSFGVHTCWASAGATFAIEELTANHCDSEGDEVVCTSDELAVFEAGVGDERIAAVIPMAGSIDRSLFGETGHTSVRVPIFAMSAVPDPRGEAEQFTSCTGLDLTWIDVEDACHETFALGMCDTLDPDEGFTIVQTYALAFARAQLLGDQTAAVLGILDGSVAVSDKVLFHSQ